MNYIVSKRKFKSLYRKRIRQYNITFHTYLDNRIVDKNGGICRGVNSVITYNYRKNNIVKKELLLYSRTTESITIRGKTYVII